MLLRGKQIEQNIETSEQTQNSAINFLIYGKEVTKLCSNRKDLHRRIFYINEYEPYILQYKSERKSFNDTRINITKLDFLTKGQNNYDQKNVISMDFRKTIIFSYKFKITILYFEKEAELELWYQGLNYFISLNKMLMQNEYLIHLELSRKIFDWADINGKQILYESDIDLLIEELRLSDQSQLINELKKTKNAINFDQFQDIMISFLSKEEIKQIFIDHVKKKDSNFIDSKKPLMTINELFSFYENEQKENIGDFINKFLQNIQLSKLSLYNLFGLPIKIGDENIIKLDWDEPIISFQDFQNILFSKRNFIFKKPDQIKLNKQMDNPLTDYYINSSHNTYLKSNQLTGESRVNQYIEALLMGCRCLELDCWDGDNNMPIIYHGYTLTSKILFSDVIKAIDQYAFVVNPYPVVLSLELHCSYNQQKVLGTTMKEIFGQKLFCLPQNHEQFVNFPSPKSLKFKILIKSTGIIGELSQVDIAEGCPSSIPVTQNYQQCKNEKLKNLSSNINARQSILKLLPSIQSTQNSNQIHPEFLRTLVLFNLSFSIDEEKLKKRQIWLNQIQIYFIKGIRVRLMKIKQQVYVKIIFLNYVILREKIFQEFIQVVCAQIQVIMIPFQVFNVEHRQSVFIIQFNKIVALNYQTRDLPMLLNLSKFQQTGSSKGGYLLKPSYLFGSNQNQYPFQQTKKKIELFINIISGTQLGTEELRTNTKISLLIKVSIRGNQIDEKANQIYRIEQIEGNYLKSKINFQINFEICDPEAGLIVFQIFDQSAISLEENILRQYAIPVLCIKQGFRVVPLRDNNLNFIDGSYLFVYTRINEIQEKTEEK